MSTLTGFESLPRGSRILIMDDGQLGRMLAWAAQRLGFVPVILGTDRESPAGQAVCNMIVVDNYHNVSAVLSAIERMGNISVATHAWENIPLNLYRAVSERIPTYPTPESLHIAQDRLLEKQFAWSLGIPVVPFLDMSFGFDGTSLDSFLPGILKTRFGGYDGKGQYRVNTPEDVARVILEHPKEIFILEKFMPFAYEVSQIACLSRQGSVAYYPLVRTTHENGILRKMEYYHHDEPLRRLEPVARQMVWRILQAFLYVGVLAVEWFVMEDGTIIFNELAPRVHNSGHWTIEGCSLNQFEAHIHAVVGFPSASTQDMSPYFPSIGMRNLLGEEILDSEDHRKVISQGGVWHDYGKKNAAPGRKMGHVTFIL